MGAEHKNIEFINKWFEAFAPHITCKQKEECHIGTPNGYLWHACSYKIIECLEKDKARAKYNKAMKKGATEFIYDPQLDKGIKECRLHF